MRGVFRKLAEAGGQEDDFVNAASEPPVPAVGDRRSHTRRADPQARSPIDPPGGPEEHAWLPGGWSFLVLAMLAGICAALVLSDEPPPMLSALCLLVALVLALPVKFVAGWVASRGIAANLFGAALCVVLPMGAFGFGMTEWVMRASLQWDVALASLAWVGAIAAVYLRRQPGLIFACQISIWATAVLAQGSLVGLIAMFLALGAAVLVSRQQLREQVAEEAQRMARERMQTRARDILADYEATRQGWFWETDRRSLLTYISQPIATALGFSDDELLGMPLVGLFDLEDTGQEGERTLLFHLSARSSFNEIPVRAAIDGEERWWSVSGRPVFDDFDNFVGFRGSGTDLTERKRSQENASRLARYDSLTGLANRFQMSQALEKILAAPRAGNRECCIMLLDLDRFKRVNDTMGHPAGDALLKQVAHRLQHAIGHLGQVGRLGGDEFQFILPGNITRQKVGQLAQDIIHALSQPYAISGQSVVIGASIGIAMAPEDGTTSEELIRNVDLALYAAKDSGRGRYHYYADDLHAEAESRAQLEQELREAINLGHLELFYQPVIATATEQISGFEALLRWRHPVKGWMPTQKFVEAAEDTGLISQIGEWALRTACRDLAEWPECVRVAVNVSALQFASPQLPAIVTSAIAQAGIDPGRLELEITESVFLNDSESTESMFAALKRIGVRLALDDFGTGYSALGYLKKAPFDKIKIDQSFVRGATEPGSRNGAIIASITSLAQALGMDTTAEGVETLDELDLVRMLGCSHVQGYIYERAMTATAASERLAGGLAATAHGPRSARAARQTMLRKIVLDHDGHFYDGTIRNISVTGALVEGLWDVPPGTIFAIHLSDGISVTATTRWGQENRMGVEFSQRLESDGAGRIIALQQRAPGHIARRLEQQNG